MSLLLETYDKNKEKHLLDEVTAGTAVGGFTGKGGQLVDKLFGGAFHPEFGNLKKLLNQQIDNDIAKRMFTDDNTPQINPDFEEIEWDYEIDKYVKKDNSKFITKDNKMQNVDIEIKYDKIVDKTEENQKFINDTSDWKSIYDNKKY